MNNEYKCGRSGGMAKIAMPADSIGITYIRSIWKDGTIHFKPVSDND